MPAVNTNYRKFFYSFGVSLESGSQLKGDCPLCLKSNHFFASPKTGQFECKSCGAKGNGWSFLSQFHKSLVKGSHEFYPILAEHRGLKPETFEHLEYVYNPLNNQWLIPCRNNEGKMVNLYHAIENERGSFDLHSSPTPCSQSLYRVDTITKKTKVIWVCEGHWDAAALIELFAHLSPTASDPNTFKLKGRPNYDSPVFETNAVVAVPGATNFAKGWCKHFQGKHTILLHDNDPTRVICPTCRGTDDYPARDHLLGQPCPKCNGTETTGQEINPAKEGINRIHKLFNESKYKPSLLQKIDWRAEDPKDIRDLIIAGINTQK